MRIWGIWIIGLCNLFVTIDQAQAQQIIPDSTLGTSSSQVFPVGNTDLILGGLESDINLFHSFEEFGIASGRVARFVSGNRAIENIFARVTGLKRSEILGTIETDGFFEGNIAPADVNLFLINPNGILFGPEARLNIGTSVRGSFLATTASQVLWSDGSQFESSANQAASRLLTISGSPSEILAASPNNAEIILQSTFLTATQGQDLQLIGGDVQIFDSTVSSLSNTGGKLTLGGLGVGERFLLDSDSGKLSVSRSEQSANTRLEIINSIISTASFVEGPDLQLFADSVLLRNTNLDLRAFGGEAGSGEIEAGDFQMSGSALRSSLIMSAGQAGSIHLTASGNFSMQDSELGSIVEANASGASQNVSLVADSISMDNSQIISVNEGAGDSGLLQVDSRSLAMSNGAQLLSAVQQGSAGDISVAAETAYLSGGRVTAEGWQATSIISRLNSADIALAGLTLPDGRTVGIRFGSGEGSSGDVRIVARELQLDGGASVSASTQGLGNAGRIEIDVSDLEMEGVAADGSVPTTLTSSVSTGGIGDGGDVRIRAKNIALRNGAQIGASVFGVGAGGRVGIQAERLFVEGTSPFRSVQQSGIFSQVLVSPRDALAVLEEGRPLEVNAVGVIGTIAIEVDTLDIRAGGQITNSLTAGGIGVAQPGAVEIQANTIEVVGRSADGRIPSNIGSQVLIGGDGVGGDVSLNANKIVIAEGASISAQNLTEGDGGNLFMRVNQLTQNQGELLTKAASGQGGNIAIEAEAGIVMGDGSLISTTAGDNQNPGDGGNIAIATPFLIGLVQSNNDVLANSFEGAGGNINIESEAILNFQLQDELSFNSALRANTTNDISASSTLGRSGLLDITGFNVDPARGAAQLPAVPASSNTVDRTCSAQAASQNSFTLSGRGGIPLSPDDFQVVSSPDAPWAALPSTASESVRALGLTKTPSAIVSPTAQPIQEASSWHRDRQGNIQLIGSIPIARSTASCNISSARPASEL